MKYNNRLNSFLLALPIFFIFVLSTFFLSTDALAKQYIAKADQETVQVIVSNTEPNVLAVDGRRITTVIPSEASALEVQKDIDQGTLYFKISPDFRNSPITAFVTDDEGVRYKIVLQPRSVTAEEIIITPPKNISTSGGRQGNSGSFIQQIKELVYTMGDDATPNRNELAIDGISKSIINVQIPLWREAQLTFLRRYDAEGMYGELYQLTNITNGNLNLLEQEFYRKGVVAVSIQNLSLQPNKSTFIYVVREQ